LPRYAASVVRIPGLSSSADSWLCLRITDTLDAKNTKWDNKLRGITAHAPDDALAEMGARRW
jgi:hypothetical protein